MENTYIQHLCEKCLQENVPKEEAEALYFCRLCKEHFCAVHLCWHLEGSFRDEENNRKIREASMQNSTLESEDIEKRILDIQETSQIRWYDISTLREDQLKARLKQLLKEAKLIQNELLARAISSSEFQYKSSSREERATRLAKKRRNREEKQAKAISALRTYIEVQKKAGLSIEQIVLNLQKGLKQKI